ncbi:MAG: hypothetical protein JSV52_07835 [Candidatus Zixiibacteriota bacterium]|nr:MAG: hypothetical protein JSV52_07835 [candidate division Zixibacteria bacterium]
MKRISSKLFLLTAISLVLTCMLSQAAVVKTDKKGTVPGKATRQVQRALGYSFPDESHGWPDGKTVPHGMLPTGTMTTAGSGPSPGVIVGYTWYDYQHSCSMGRMVETGPHSGETGKAVVHFGWMYLPDSFFVSRSYAYSAYHTKDHSLLSPVILHDPEKQYSGYVNIDATSDNRAVIGGHCDLLTGATHYMPQMHFDGGPAYALFPNYVRVPDSLAAYEQLGDDESMWPKFMLQFGSDTVLHVTGRNWEYEGTLMYFRLVGYEGSADAVWDYPPYVYDTAECYSHDLTGERNGDRLAMSWLASLPYGEPLCDTCSGETIYTPYLVGQMDNDIYYQMSDDQGATWEPRVNLTRCPIGEAVYKAYPDLSLLFDQNSNLHIVWTSVPWPADECIDDGGFCFTEPNYTWIDKARIFHWSENVPYIRPLCDHTYQPSDSCGAPKWAVNVGKLSVSECAGKLYCIWSQFNDIPNGIYDDCALWAYEEDLWEGAANADIWVSVSADAGMTWDRQRNLTNSYTPNCDPIEGENCQSDYWASMSRWGRQSQLEEDWSGAVVVDPSGGGYSGDHYLDIQYVNDLDAGGAIWADADGSEGTWTLTPIKWFRMPCVEPVPCPIIVVGWESLGEPCWIKPGVSFDTNLIVENIGNATLTYTVDVIEDNGPTGWLAATGFSGSIPSGLAGMELGNIRLNDGGIITTTGNYFGRLHFEGNDPVNLPLDVEIELIVADTLVTTEWDYLTATLPTEAVNGVSLTVSNNGNMGHDGRGMYNMDYYPDDCDTTAKVYMYDGSPLVGWLNGGDTVYNYAIWGQVYFGEFGFRPQGYQLETKMCALVSAEVYESGNFTSQDSTIAMEKIYLAPQGEGPFMIEYLRVWSYDGAAHDGLMIGEAIDWDIPNDFLPTDTNQERFAINSGGTDQSRNLVYCQGYEAYGAGSDTLYPYNCQNNDARFGGSAFVESYLNGARRSLSPYGGYVAENDSLQTANGFYHGLLYQEMIQPGFRATDSVEDLHTVITYENGYNLGPTDTLEFISILATVHEGTLADLQAAVDIGRTWYYAHDSIDMFEDALGDGFIDICVICCHNDNFGEFYSHPGEFNILDIDNFIEWLLRNPGVPPIYDCAEQVDVSSPTAGVPDGSVDILDVDYMIGYLLRGTYETLGECP